MLKQLHAERAELEKMERFRAELRKLRYDPSKYKTYMEQLGIHYPTVR